MKINLIQVGGTVDKYLKAGVAEYQKRLSFSNQQMEFHFQEKAPLFVELNQIDR